MKQRMTAAALLAVVVAGALWVRTTSLPVPAWLRSDLPDLLYTTAVFLLLRCVHPKLRPAACFTTAVGLSWLVEFSQLLDTPLLNSLRAQRLGALVLGRGFETKDLLSYLLGGLLGAALDRGTRCIPATSDAGREAPSTVS